MSIAPRDKVLSDLLVAARIAAEELEYFIEFAVKQCEFEGDEDAARGSLNSLRIAAHCAAHFLPQKAGDCPSSPNGRHQIDTSMESGPSNCFYCEGRMP